MTKQEGPKVDKSKKALTAIITLKIFCALSVFPLGLLNLQPLVWWELGKEVDVLWVVVAAVYDCAWIAGALRLEYLRNRDRSQDTDM